MTRVGVLGAAGRMGRLVCRAIAEDPELVLAAAVNPSFGGEHLGVMIGHPEIDVRISDDRETLLQAESEVVVDFTTPSAVMDNVRWGIEHAIHMVVGTTGIGPPELADIERLIEAEGHESNVIVAPNFAIGAVLLQLFSALAARYFAAAEIIELHHEGKADAPSGTALATAERMAKARQEAWSGPTGESLDGVRGGDVDGIRIHSVRLPGLVAHQEVIFGGTGQTLTVRHDSLQRESFMPGVLLAIKSVVHHRGLTVGLEPLLDLPQIGL
ncbi:MAG TPA: 4-hydroxy-tetrahydrodipicolinate reductase [Actinomycetota bacterium]|nr:4-hydroxy-tetrahydrodipicolinate reductase [Actinomycetota bacterium]